MYRFQWNCWALVGLLVLAGESIAGCVMTGSAAAITKSVDTIDYPALNRLLMTGDSETRRRHLPAEIAALQDSPASASASVRAHLLLALARAEIASGDADAAIRTLKRFPLNQARAPEALLLLATLEAQRGEPAIAVQWFLRLADQFPDDARAVEGLLDAATLVDSSRLLLLERARSSADQGLQLAKQWQAQSMAPGFPDLEADVPLPDVLWRFARAALTDPAFIAATQSGQESRHQLGCLLAQEEARRGFLEKNPRLLSDLAETVATLDRQLADAQQDFRQREKDFLSIAEAWHRCNDQKNDCADLRQQHDQLGREMTGWRNRIATLQAKRNFLKNEQQALPLRWQRTHTASQQHLQVLHWNEKGARRIMRELLQQELRRAVDEWEALSAKAHFQLAVAQEQFLPEKTAHGGIPTKASE
ncbi:MAG: hypothetical protein Q8J78_05765 [Moraxellaceae bacterium]|nr:hypothetical protein [Moraxellaceae bacterium]